MAKKKQKKSEAAAGWRERVDNRTLALGGAAIAGGIGLIALGLTLRSRGSFDGMFPSAEDVDGDDSPGTIDRGLGMPSEGAGELGGASAAGTLTSGAAPANDAAGGTTSGGSAIGGARAPDEFRPDPTAPVAEDKRDAFAPATLPNPNQTTPAM